MYKIKIEQEVTEMQTTKGDWQVVERRPYTEEELKQMTSYDRTKCSEGKDIQLTSIYGYPPAIEKPVKVTKQILIQEVETLDLVAVIKALNNIK